MSTLTAAVFAGRETSLDAETRVEQAVAAERARREARRRLDAEEHGPRDLPPLRSLRERLSVPRPQIRYRIEQLQPIETRVILTAQHKTGKTTAVGSLLRSLVDGDTFLEAFAVTPLAASVALLDFEMGDTMLADWLASQRIQHDDRVLVASLRGRGAAFDILDPHVRQQWAARLRQQRVAYLVVDPLRPVLDSIGLDENHDAGRILTAFDSLLSDAGISEACLIHHMGHTGERARGDSRLRDWPDVEWKLVRESDDSTSARYLTAFGRDVDVPEQRLTFDSTTRRLSVAGGSRRDARTDRVLGAVTEVLAASQPLSGRAIVRALDASEYSRDAIQAALPVGVRQGRLVIEDGPRRSKLYRLKGTSERVNASVRPVNGVQSCESVYECTDDSNRVVHSVHSHSPSPPVVSAPAPPYSPDPSACQCCGRESCEHPLPECLREQHPVFADLHDVFGPLDVTVERIPVETSARAVR